MCRVVYSPKYNIGFYGLERLHPFDSRKYERAWKQLRARFGKSLRQIHVSPERTVSPEELLLVHTERYLKQLSNSMYVAQALELAPLQFLPFWIIDHHVLRPMRWATRGTIVAAQEALEHGLAINLSGGYHHAKPAQGEGFCVYADAAIAVAALRQQALISETDRIVYVDTDAHQGNGVSHAFMNDNRAFLFDIFNARAYPQNDVAARERLDCEIGITGNWTDREYMLELENNLPGFLDSVCQSPVRLAIYNAGTDIFAGDPLGGLNISAATIRERDLYVVSELRKRQIPTIMLLSGGYTKQSFQLVADSVTGLLEREGY